MEYGLDVKWAAGEVKAFLAFNKMCNDQAIAVFNAKANGEEPPAIIPAKILAERARAMFA